jgi:lysophospholipase L1-like esterase
MSRKLPVARHSALRRSLRRAALVTLSAGAALLVVEASLRSVNAAPPTIAGPSAPLCRPLSDASGRRYELVPGVRITQQLEFGDRAASRSISYSINPLGFRGRLVTPTKPPGERRIAVVGDSFVFGSLVDDDETLPRQLEARLAARHPEERLQVLNLGVPGYQVRQLVTTLERVSVLQPDVVLLNFFVNDPVDTPLTYRATEPDPECPPLGWEQRCIVGLGLMGAQWAQREGASVQERTLGWLCRRSALADLLADRLYWSLYKRVNVRNYRHNWRADGPGYARILAAIDRGRALGERHGFELQVSLYPLLTELDHYPLAEVHRRLAIDCAARDVVFHDLLPPLAGLRPSSLWAHPQDHHPNAACHGLAAARLAEGLAPWFESLPPSGPLATR